MDSLLPFLQGTCTPYNMPVYPGARRMVANSEMFLASADVRYFKQVKCPVWSKDKITQK